MSDATMHSIDCSAGKNAIADWGSLQQACMGCGLCRGAFGIAMKESPDGFLRPDCDDPEAFRLVSRHCPAINYPTIYDGNPWGRTEAAFIGWSLDGEVRQKASSGGVISSVLIYALESRLVDKVLHVGSPASNPLYGEALVSSCRGDVLERCGSRYVSCSALEGLDKIRSSGSKFAVVGRPCEIRALCSFLGEDEDLGSKIVLKLSFFCAGLPSRNAARRLLDSLGHDETSLESFTYRGNGWPGYATAVGPEGASRMSYNRSWGEILGRDIEDYCKFCFDGVGEYADISAGDAWHQSEDGSPDFSEADGRNVVFARTPLGLDVLRRLEAGGSVHLEAFSDWDYLRKIQKAQFERKALLKDRLMVLRLAGKKFQSADVKRLGPYSTLGIAKRARSALGLLKRLGSGRINLP